MKISYDELKRLQTLDERGLDFDDAELVFAGLALTLQDERKDYGEDRYQTYGLLRGRLIMMVWTPRGDSRRIISMRNCHGKEEAQVRPRLR